MNTIKTALLVAGIVAASLGLGACRDDEQGRSLADNKGHYAGKPDTPLSNDARRALMQRVQHQGGLDTSGAGTAGAASASSSADVRPPGPRE